MSAIDITPLLPQPVNPAKSIVDILPKPKNNSIHSLLLNTLHIRMAVISLEGLGKAQPVKSSEDYTEYLQYPNAQIKSLASQIVSPTDSNDMKMYKIEQWVKDNIEYVSDIENYKMAELWIYPTVTLAKGSGDCEDGAFLIHSLALHAGVPVNRLRTYGGLVMSGDQALFAGHAWTSYKRESDDQWVITDWCYWSKDTPLSERTPMKTDMKYIDDFFWFDIRQTVETWPFVNAVRYPDLQQRGVYLSKGMLLNYAA